MWRYASTPSTIQVDLNYEENAVSYQIRISHKQTAVRYQIRISHKQNQKWTWQFHKLFIFIFLGGGRRGCKVKPSSGRLYFRSGRRTSCLEISKLCLNRLQSRTVTHTLLRNRQCYGHESLKIEGRYLHSISYAKSTITWPDSRLY
jgi:hypothetical protein